MLRRRFLCLMAVILGLTLLPVTALARDHDRDWGHNRSTYNRGHNHNYGNGYYRNGYYGYGNNGYYGYNNGYYGNGNYGCVDRDNDGDCDHIRHHHHYYQNGWNGNPYVYSNPNVYSYPNVGGIILTRAAGGTATGLGATVAGGTEMSPQAGSVARRTAGAIPVCHLDWRRSRGGGNSPGVARSLREWGTVLLSLVTRR